MSRLLWHIDIFKVFKTHKTVNVCGKIQSQEMLPFLCLLTAARWRHKTLLSRRQHKLRVKELLLQTVAISNTNIVVIIASYLFLNNEIFLQSRLPFDLFKLVDVTAECATMGRLVCSHAFTLFPANTSVFSNVFGSLFKIPPLRSGGTSAQNINNLKDS